MNRKEKERIIFVVSIAILNDPVYQKRLWIAARNMLISRRRWADAIADALYNFDGVILLPSGLRWPIPDVDKVLGDPRWFSYYFEADENGEPRRGVPGSLFCHAFIFCLVCLIFFIISSLLTFPFPTSY